LNTYVALLRGINVGGRNKIAMKDLRASFVALGHGEITTCIQSGNVAFRSASIRRLRTRRDRSQLEHGRQARRADGRGGLLTLTNF
jgi:uncharacterized protein (DUF1697 family)